jgi:hypothetical protein
MLPAVAHISQWQHSHADLGAWQVQLLAKTGGKYDEGDKALFQRQASFIWRGGWFNSALDHVLSDNEEES